MEYGAKDESNDAAAADLLTKCAKHGCRNNERNLTAPTAPRQIPEKAPDWPQTRARGMLLPPRQRRGVRGRGNGMGASKREGVTPTHDWQLLLPLFEWPEQERATRRSAP